MNSQKTLSKQLLLLALWLILATIPLFSIGFVPGSGQDTTAGINQDRDRDFYYHNNTDDQHWYGAEKFAVRFTFPTEYPEEPDTQFKINKIRVYFPVLNTPANNATVKLLTDVHNVPGVQLTTITSPVTSHWQEFTLVSPITIDTVWVVVEYATSNVDNAGPYISASNGGGAHSYFWNTNATVPYFQNMATAGYHSEFLFNVVGSFVIDDLDLQLASFDLKPIFTPNSTLHPEFKIINNSDSAITNGSIDVTISSPNPTFAIRSTIYLIRDIPPQSELFVSYTNRDYAAYEYRLPFLPTQFKVVAILHSEFDAADTLLNNNTITHYYNSFSDINPIKLVENFIRTETSTNLLTAQDTLITHGDRIINYFPIAGDANYVLGATQRYNWYGFGGVPQTVIGGNHIINGFVSQTYADDFTYNLARLDTLRTFLTQTVDSLKINEPYTSLVAKVTLRNLSTFMYTSAPNPVMTSQSRFYAALCKNVRINNRERLVFSRWGAFADTIGTALDFGTFWQKQFNVTVGDVTVDDLRANYSLIYWIQQLDKKIIYANELSLNDIVASDDETTSVVPLEIELAPNPVRLGSNFKLLFPKGSAQGKISCSIYNTKGQLVQSSNFIAKQDNNIINTDKIKASGLYLIKFTLTDKSNPHRNITKIKKVLVY